jgi:DNA helicase-2/ATP-dependent DNA helicase PcrA
LWTENEPDGDAPDVVESCYGDGDDEAAGIADCISELVADGTSPDEIAVLYRINALSRGLEKTMFEASLPYRMLRGVAFYERREVRDTLAYLQFLYNGDERAFTRIANVPKRGMGEKTLQAIIEAARSDIPALLSSVLRAANVAGKLVYGHLGPKEWQEVIRQTGLTRLKIGTIQRVHELAQIFAGLRAMVDEGRPVGDLVGELLDGEGVGLARYFAGLDEAGEDRVANARELLTVAARVEAAGDEGLAAFLELCSLGDEASKDVSGDEMPRITLGTLHSAKGLEWDYVFIAAAEQELAPGRNSKGADLEEERRLFYVGMTRARKRVTASWARFRVLYGEGQLRTRSQFIEEAGVEVES